MLEKTTRDAAFIEALREGLAQFDEWIDAAARVLARERPRGGRRGRAAITHALGFETWRSLERRQGLPREEAVDLMARLAACAAG